MVFDFLRNLFLFRYDKYNPYRRYCKKCGQMQEQFCYNFKDFTGRGWWEDMGKIYNEKCKCHKKQIYKR